MFRVVLNVAVAIGLLPSLRTSSNEQEQQATSPQSQQAHVWCHVDELRTRSVHFLGQTVADDVGGNRSGCSADAASRTVASAWCR